ncbi:RDD family protein [Amycolatopsis sp. FDAARGOS 1241]|uniref:RDD family protein n=1 Tax=Amycolatopsis sp. FDAARGOS 1241 TaxID=2778070 RepID=UPI001950FEE9|nr:RDD family protein [Amycolatopsis sp. FDAARGOS 1241]QRP45011.1 RDD family protein [Amycolatopsis sp. FDAARGOS 1241]
MQEESDLVTGEAVVLDLRVAKLASRGVAMLIDVLVQAAFLLIVVVVVAVASPDLDPALSVALLLTVFVLVVIGYPVLFETLSRGRSLGKLALGLRVVRLDGGPIRFRHALTRALAGFFVDFWALGFLGAVAVIVSLSSSNGRRVGDYLAGTLVIRERVPHSAQAYVAMPPGLEGWAAQLDLSRLPDDLALAARQFLARFQELRPDAAEALGYGLAQQVAHAIGVAVPYGMPAWVFLSAVLAERRNRDQARLAQQVYAGAQAPQPPYQQQPAYHVPSAVTGFQQPWHQPPPSDRQPAPSAHQSSSPPQQRNGAAPAQESRPPEPENPFTPPS